MDDPDRELTASQLDGVCGGTGETSGMDIEALAFFSLMGAAKSNQEDMKIIMQEVEHGSIGQVAASYPLSAGARDVTGLSSVSAFPIVCLCDRD